MHVKSCENARGKVIGLLIDGRGQLCALCS